MMRKQRKDDGQRRGDTARTAGRQKRKVVILNAAKREGHKILRDFQYEYVRAIVKRLEGFGHEHELSDLRIEPIEDFWELKEKGGVLGKINLRIYFGTVPEDNEVVVAMAYKKEDDGRVPRHIVIAVQNRLEEYRTGKQQ